MHVYYTPALPEQRPGGRMIRSDFFCQCDGASWHPQLHFAMLRTKTIEHHFMETN